VLILVTFTAIGLVLFIGALVGLQWAVRSGQMDDLETPALRMLIDETPTPVVPTSATEKESPQP
jgi:cbb3-type cytochrome oxidase maturation protein